jgi:AcrR family transcriptional regulator
MSPRPYDLGRRKEQIDDNRRRVIEAAQALLAEATTYTAFTVDAVAKRADVARATVYYQFGSKTGLLEALCDALAAAGQLTELAEVFNERDPRQAIRAFIMTFTRFWAADRLVMRRLRALAALDPDVAAVIEARDERHRNGLSVLVGRLAGPKTGFPAKQVDQAVRVIHALSSFECYDSLAGPNNDPAEVAPVLIDLAEAALTPRPRQATRAPRKRRISQKKMYPQG